GPFVYTEVQKARTYTSEIAACNTAEYQFSSARKDTDEKLSAYLHAKKNLTGLTGPFEIVHSELDFRLASYQSSQDIVVQDLAKKYLVACSSSVLKERRAHDYYSTSAPYWACTAFMSLAVAGIGLTINRRKEE
ncbi:MAG: hypothetical protein AABY26_06220, partial [Nanoarchaeota archaeon]